MKLRTMCEPFIGPFVFHEGYGRRNKFDYQNANVDPSPDVWKLGTFIHPTTGNNLLAGINLNYLDNEQTERLKYYAPEILKDKNLKTRYWTGRKLLPDIFTDAYRTYDQQYIDSLEPDSLKFNKQLSSEPGVEPIAPPEPPGAPPAPKPVAPAPSGRKLTPKAKAPVPAPPPETEKDRAQQAVDAQRADKMSQRIDQRTKELYDQPTVPPPVQDVSPIPLEPAQQPPEEETPLPPQPQEEDEELPPLPQEEDEELPPLPSEEEEELPPLPPEGRGNGP